MVDLTLSEEQQALQRTGRDFALNEIKPLAEKIRNGEVQGEPWSVCKDLYAKGVELGFTGLLVPEQYGGLGLSCMDLVVLMEELATGDIGIAGNYFSLTATIQMLLVVGGTEEQKQKWLPYLLQAQEPHLPAGALSEPNVAGSELFCPIPDPKFGIKTFAKREGDHYVLNGNKSAFVTNAGAADLYFVMARSDLEKPLQESISIFIVPADTPGLRTGQRTELIGCHTGHHAEVFLDDVRVPAENLIGEDGAGGMIFAQVPQMAIALAACYVGLARSAYEYALAYAQERKSWGKPIIEHQAVALKLADMAVDVQAARLLVWDAALACETNPMAAATLKSPAAKTAAVDAAIKNAERAVQILGAYGVTKEYAAGGFLNDAWVGYACDFTRDMLRLSMVPFLKEQD